MGNFIKSYKTYIKEEVEYDYLSPIIKNLSKKVGVYFGDIKNKYKYLYTESATKVEQELGTSVANGIIEILKMIHSGEIDNISDLNNHMKLFLNKNKIDITLSDN